MPARRRYALPALSGFLLLAVVPTALADSVGITATLTTTTLGSRSITSIPAVSLTSLSNAGTASGPMSVVVTETAMAGGTWSVTTALAPNASASNATVLKNTLTTATIPASALRLAVSSASAAVGTGGGTTSVGAGGTLDAARTVMSNAGQVGTTLYTGVYTATGTVTLTVPNGQAAGTYAGTLTVTLVQ
jgi:hypothetical protein